MDALSIQRIQASHPKIIQPALDAYGEICCALKGRAFCRINEGYRSFAKQAEYYALGRTKVNPDGKSKTKPMGNIITNAIPGKSCHQYGLALDICLQVDTDGNGSYETAKWDAVGDYDGDKVADWYECLTIFKNHGFTIGAEFRTFPDLPHVEMTFGYSVSELLEKHNNKDFILGTNWVNITPKPVMYVTISNLNLRTSVGGSVIRVLPKGTQIAIIKKEGVWANVKTSEGLNGWLHTDYVA